MRHWFEGGVLTADAPAPETITATAEGSVGLPVLIIGNPVTNLIDDTNATYIMRVDSQTDYAFARLDLGAAKLIDSVVLDGVVSTLPAGQLRCYVANAASLSNPIIGGTPLAANKAANGRVVWQAAAPISARYIYISVDPASVPGAGGPWTITIAEAYAWTMQTIPFATLQRVSLEIVFQAAQLNANAEESMFSIDCAHFGGQVNMAAEHVNVEPNALLKVLNCNESGIAWTTLKPVKAGITLPPLKVTLEGKDTKGKIIRFVGHRCFAPGETIDFQLGQFVNQSVNFTCYLNTAGEAGYLQFQE